MFESRGLALQEWDKTCTDWVTFQQYIQPISEKPSAGSTKTASFGIRPGLRTIMRKASKKLGMILGSHQKFFMTTSQSVIFKP